MNKVTIESVIRNVNNKDLEFFTDFSDEDGNAKLSHVDSEGWSLLMLYLEFSKPIDFSLT